MEPTRDFPEFHDLAIIWKMETMIIDRAEAREKQRPALERGGGGAASEQSFGGEELALDRKTLVGTDAFEREVTSLGGSRHPRGIRNEGASPRAEFANEEVVERVVFPRLVFIHRNFEVPDEGRDFVSAHR
jgi:hypothetical protein